VGKLKVQNQILPKLQTELKIFLKRLLLFSITWNERTIYLKYPIAERLILSSKAVCACEGRE
jgi:hypothetical protein